MSIKKWVLRTLLLLVCAALIAVLTIVGSFYALFYEPVRSNGSLISSGQEREYLLHVPPSYDPIKPTPLVISLHGAALWPATQMKISQWNKVSDEHGFLVVYPSGRSLGGSGTGLRPKVWSLSAEDDELSDVTFIGDLIDTLTETYSIDPSRIYVNGLSQGGGMAFALSCTMSHRIAAVGLVAAAQTLPWNWCKDSTPVPLIAFHGTADPMVPYEGGPSGDPFNPVTFPDVRDWTRNWARRNRCSPEPVESAVTSDVTRAEYTSCAHDAGVVLYTIRGGGHTWPGGSPMPEWLVGTTSRSVDASSQMWAFFDEHVLPD